MRTWLAAGVAAVVLAVTAFALLAPSLATRTEAPPPRAAALVTPATAPPAAVPVTAQVADARAASNAAPRQTAALLDTLQGTIASVTRAFGAASGDDRVLYAAALRARDAGAYGYAIDSFRTVAGRGGILAPVAALRLAQAQVSDGQREPAAASFAAALARADLPAELLAAARFDAADNLVAVDRRPAALELLGAVRSDAGASSFDGASAAWQAAELRRDAGDTGWVDDAVAAVALQPASSSAQHALDALDAAGASAPALAAAYVRYRAYQNDLAMTRYRAIAADPPDVHDAAIAWFYIGALDERADDPLAALDDYARSLATDPTGALADDARYWRARIYEGRGDYRAAVSEYDLLVAAFPRSAFASDAALRAAQQLALHGAIGDALDRLDSIAQTAAPSDAAAAARWDAVFRRVYGMPANPSLSARAIDPVVLPALLRDGPLSLPAASILEAPVYPTDAGAADAWLTATYGPRPAVPDNGVPVLDDPRYVLGRELVGVGEASVGKSLLLDLVAERSARPYDLFDLATAAQTLDLPNIAVSAATSMFRRLTDGQLLSAPRSVLALAYPLGYLTDTTTAAHEWSLPALLVEAVVRQESAFDATAGSSAGAIGLMQISPPTGTAIAASLGIPWQQSLLQDPSTSLRFGAYYLSHELTRFDGDLLAALAAYNGGPTNAARWRSSAPFPGPDGYLLAVDFGETATYLARVLENYAWYRYIYAGAPTPSLP